MSAVADAGLQVPGDVAVTGYDDTFVSAIRQVSLTSVNPDSSGIGSLAAHCVLRRIEDPGRPAQEHLLPPRLVTRYSSGGRLDAAGPDRRRRACRPRIVTANEVGRVAIQHPRL
jgi:DNA-binding LacI/PurR family transcriptional regulator